MPTNRAIPAVATPRMRRTAIGVLASVLGVGALLFGACAAPMALRDPPSDPPGEFGLAVAVLPGMNHSNPGRDDHPGVSAARYILEPDGSLRASTGDGGAGSFPPIVRRIDAKSRAHVWRLTLATGAHDPTDGQRVTSPDLYRSNGAPAAVVTVAWGDGRSAAAFDPDDPATRALVEELARLAWVRP